MREPVVDRLPSHCDQGKVRSGAAPEPWWAVRFAGRRSSGASMNRQESHARTMGATIIEKSGGTGCRFSHGNEIIM